MSLEVCSPNHILVENLKSSNAEEKVGSILTLRTSDNYLQKALVMSIPPASYSFFGSPDDIKQGDIILYRKDAGIPVDYEGRLCIVHKDDVYLKDE